MLTKGTDFTCGGLGNEVFTSEIHGFPSDWFAKRGIPWHFKVVLMKRDQSVPLKKETIVRVFQSCLQDNVEVAAILQDVLATLNKPLPDLKKVTANKTMLDATIVALPFEVACQAVR